LNVLKPYLRITIETLLKSGTPQREIARRTGVDRKTIRSYAAALANSPGVATGSEAVEGQIPPPRATGSDADSGSYARDVDGLGVRGAPRLDPL
jgi:hypothetical protein